MAQKRRTRHIAEVCALLVVILVPVGLGAYAWWDQSAQNATPAPEVSDTVQTPSTTPAVISLDDPSSLPQSVSAAELVPFSFTIQNTGNASGTIPYKVYVKWSTGEEDVIDENIIDLNAGASLSIPEQLKFEIATETAEVYLELTQTGKTSQFALPQTQ